MEEKSNAVLRTEKRLRVAYAQLLSEKNYKDINVKELCDRAEMSRATFYLHFGSLEEFTYHCKKHIIREISRQLIFWFDNRNDIDNICRKRNLIISQSDRELFKGYFQQEIYFKDPDDYTVNPYFYDYFKEKYSESFVSENIEKIDFFIRAYSVTFMEVFISYSSEPVKKELKYVFLMWDRLFPEKPI